MARIDTLAQSIGDEVMEADALQMRGTIRAESGDIAGALESFHRARDLLAGTDALAKLARTTNAIGIAYNFTGDVARGKTYIEQALEIARRSDDRTVELLILGNLALAVSALEGPAAGLPFHYETLALGREHNQTRVVAYQLASICANLVTTGQLDEAERTCDEALEHARTLGHVRLLAGVELSMGDLLRARGRPAEALAQYEQALRTDSREGSMVALQTAQKMAAIHEELGNYEEALNQYRRTVEVRDGMLADERRRTIEELEVQFAARQRDREIDMLRLDADLQAIDLERRSWMLFGVSIALAFTIILGLVAWRGYRNKALLQQQLAKLAREDPLTGRLNRRAFLEIAERALARARRDKLPLSVVVGDIDDFKALNDKYGHPVGDAVLVEVAARLDASARMVDAVCRWGGEEFVLLLPDTDANGALDAMNRRRDALAAKPIETSAGTLSVTMTFGIATVEDDIESAIEAADRAMYEGKHTGRNRVVVSG
ncbi:MAG: diguanylate cyclase [Xanthomonadaceae bacterium]|nr:diguanylate cyclase [Xanthomonadaceae bacterium]